MVIQPTLDLSGTTPIYRQLSEYLQQMITGGELQPGDRLPPTRDLAGQLGLNRTTVSAAYDCLHADGLIESRGARGSFVKALGLSATDAVDWQKALLPSLARPALAPATGAIDFTTSRPAANLFPLEDFRSSANEVLGSVEMGNLLQLGSPRGYEPLRRYLLDAAQAAGTARPEDDILITSGCQQAVDLLRRALVRPGDRVLAEDPVYPGLRNSFQEAGAELEGIPVGDEGIDLLALEGNLPGAKLLVVTPSFQNPTGMTIPAVNRAALVEKARLRGVLVVENDIYSDLRYFGASMPPLKQLDGEVIQIGSFSKIAFPGLRVGWILAPKPVIDRVAELKQITDLHTDQLSQALLLHFAAKGLLSRHRDRAVAAGREKLRGLEQSLKRSLPDCRWTLPSGGMNLWLRLPPELDANTLRVFARQAGVDFLPGSYFGVSRPFEHALRLSFIGLELSQIRKGVEVLGQVVRGSTGLRGTESDVPATAMV